jgi:lipid-A-disaccharide synthase
LADKPGAVFVLPRAPTLAEGLIRERLGAIAGRTRVLSGRACDALAVAEAALVASGTATLEAAIIGTPMVVLGAVSWPSYLLAKPFIPVTEFSLPNVIAGRRIVPELIQGEARPDRALAELSNLLDHRDKLETMKAELARVKAALGEPGASRRAAAAVNRRLWGEV